MTMGDIRVQVAAAGHVRAGSVALSVARTSDGDDIADAVTLWDLNCKTAGSYIELRVQPCCSLLSLVDCRLRQAASARAMRSLSPAFHIYEGVDHASLALLQDLRAPLLALFTAYGASGSSMVGRDVWGTAAGDDAAAAAAPVDGAAAAADDDDAAAAAAILGEVHMSRDAFAGLLEAIAVRCPALSPDYHARSGPAGGGSDVPLFAAAAATSGAAVDALDDSVELDGTRGVGQLSGWTTPPAALRPLRHGRDSAVLGSTPRQRALAAAGIAGSDAPVSFCAFARFWVELAARQGMCGSRCCSCARLGSCNCMHLRLSLSHRMLADAEGPGQRGSTVCARLLAVLNDFCATEDDFTLESSARSSRFFAAAQSHVLSPEHEAGLARLLQHVGCGVRASLTRTGLQRLLSAAGAGGHGVVGGRTMSRQRANTVFSSIAHSTAPDATVPVGDAKTLVIAIALERWRELTPAAAAVSALLGEFLALPGPPGGAAAGLADGSPEHSTVREVRCSCCRRRR